MRPIQGLQVYEDVCRNRAIDQQRGHVEGVYVIGMGLDGCSTAGDR